MMGDDWSRIVSSGPSGPHRPGEVLRVFPGDAVGAGAEVRVETSNNADDLPVYGHVGSMNQAGAEVDARLNRFRLGRVADSHPRVVRIVQHDAPSDKPGRCSSNTRDIATR